jgi:hypothetical protein
MNHHGPVTVDTASTKLTQHSGNAGGEFAL